MKKAIVVGSIIAVVLMVFFLIKNDSSKEVTNYPPDNNVIIVLGDSLVEGVGATQGNDFVSVLSRNIGVPIENLGVSGNTTEDGLNRIGEILSKNPDITLLLLGGNDYLRKIPREKTLENLENIIIKLHDAGSIVVLLGVRGGLLKDNFKNDFENLSKKFNTAYVPNVLQGLIGKSEFMSDQIHPNDKGYVLIAEKVEPILEKLLAP